MPCRDLQFGAVNCEQHRELCADQQVQAYPTLKSLVPGEDRLVDFSTEHSAPKIRDAAMALLPGGIITPINRKSRLDSFLQDSCGAGPKKAGQQRATWDACAVLFTK